MCNKGCHSSHLPHLPLLHLHHQPRPSAWGVADSAAYWSPATGRSLSYLWSQGATPFGPLSTSRQLSFVQRDAMKRNMALAALNASVGHARLLLEGVVAAAGPGVTVKTLLAADQVGWVGLVGVIVFVSANCTLLRLLPQTN